MQPIEWYFLVYNILGLKKLSLKDLNQMPGITDELFESVLQKLNLLELKLSSSKPLKKVNNVIIFNFGSFVDECM